MAKNENCLEGFRCPECGYEKRFRIDSKTTFDVTDDGTDEHEDVYWDDDSFCACPECDHEGMVIDFRIEHQLVGPDVKCWPIGSSAPALRSVATLLYNYLVAKELTTNVATERNGGIVDVERALEYAGKDPLKMCIYLEKLSDWTCDNEIYDAFKLVPHFEYIARRAERVQTEG